MGVSLVKNENEYYYKYPQVIGGYRWNILKRCLKEVGVEPLYVGDMPENSILYTFVVFSAPLTAPQEAALNTLMSNNPQFPPSPGANTRFIIKDIYEFFDQFEADVGVGLDIYFSETVPGSGEINRIEIIANKAMTNAEKNKLRNAYSSLITEG